MISERSGRRAAVWDGMVPSVQPPLLPPPPPPPRAADDDDDDAEEDDGCTAVLSRTHSPPPSLPGMRWKSDSLARTGATASCSRQRYEVPDRMATSRSSSWTVTQVRLRISASNSGMPRYRLVARGSCSDVATRATKLMKKTSCSGSLARASVSRASAIMHRVRMVVRLGAAM